MRETASSRSTLHFAFRPVRSQCSRASSIARRFFSSIPTTYSKRVKSSGRSGRDREVRITPRRFAAAAIRGSALSPSW